MRRNISAQEKLEAVQEYLNGHGSRAAIANKYSVSKGCFEKWEARYKAFGVYAFVNSGSNQSYTKEFKDAVVQAYLAGEGSYSELAIKYKIPSLDTIRRWVLKYNGHETLNSYKSGGYPIMAKGRKTSFNERVKIVEYCIAYQHNYNETAKKFDISYQQARNYTIKYETGGAEALKDNRGKRRLPDEMSELEKLRAENKILKAEKQRAEMEASFLKKLGEIERGRG